MNDQLLVRLIAHNLVNFEIVIVPDDEYEAAPAALVNLAAQIGLLYQACKSDPDYDIEAQAFLDQVLELVRYEDQ